MELHAIAIAIREAFDSARRPWKTIYVNCGMR
jgi:hypothetical protein